MKYLVSLLFFFAAFKSYAQNGTTFTIENLSKPEGFLKERASEEIYHRLIEESVRFSQVELEQTNTELPYNILAKSSLPDSLVTFNYHSFFDGMYAAYAHHRPFVLSPDMIWLLISQGFAAHVNQNAEALRNHFVDFDKKLNLMVPTGTIDLDNPNSRWEDIFPEFRAQIAANTGEELMNILSADFSTTNPACRIASEITIMKAMEPYFEYVLLRTVCGIPEVTLQGTPEDWQKILDKTQKLAKYDLAWWTSELEPLLKQFIKASNGKVHRKFWRNMFKFHSPRRYGAPIVDGWIVKFFPYDKEGHRNNLKQIKDSEKLPEEIVKVDLKYIAADQKETQLELWAGFVGLEQNKSNFALTPQISWMIRKKDVEDKTLTSKFEIANNSKWAGISIRVKEIPAALYRLEKINSIQIDFIDGIKIPDQLANIQIGVLKLSGTIAPEEIERIKKLFPKTR